MSTNTATGLCFIVCLTKGIEQISVNVTHINFQKRKDFKWWK